MSHFDIRYTIPVFINLLKFGSEALPWDWDAFNILNPNQTSWLKISFHISLLLLFSFTSMTIFPAHPFSNTTLIRFQVGNFSRRIALLLVASLLFPQALFWFLYPAMLILSCFLDRVNVRLSALPSWNVRISSSLTHHHQEADIDMESQAPLHDPVGEDFIPAEGDDDSHAEANDENMGL